MLPFKRMMRCSITAVLVFAFMLSAVGTVSAENVAAERESLTFQLGNYGIMDKPVESIPTTAEVWVKLQPNVNTRQIIVGNYKDGKQNSWSLELTADNRLRYWEEYYDAQGVKKGISNLYVTGVDVATNEWMLLSVVRDVANQQIIFYKNGTKVFEKTGYTAIAPSNTISTLPMYVGTDYRKSMWLNGEVSEIRLWNQMRTPEQISQYVTTELTGSEAGLAHAWRLSDAAGTSPTATFSDLVSTNPIKITTEGFPTSPVITDPTDPTDHKKRVLILGLDGTRPDALQEANTPNLDQLMHDGASYFTAWANASDTWSGTGWSSILTGVWKAKHGVTNNSFTGSNFAAYPNLFKRAKQVKPNLYISSIVQWAPINTNIIDGINMEFRGETDEIVTAKAVQHLQFDNPDLTFVHFDEIDAAGHSTGFTPQNANYMAAIQKADAEIGRIMNAIKARSTYSLEDWLIIVTTDHGGVAGGGNGGSHGGTSETERKVFMIVSGPSAAKGMINPPSTPYPSNTTTPNTLTGIIQPDVGVTALTHLGIPINPAWNLDGRAVGLASSPPLIRGIKVNGTNLSSFSSEVTNYNMNVVKAIGSVEPVIDVDKVSDDVVIDITTDNSNPNIKKVKATSADGQTSKEYSLNLTQTDQYVSDLEGVSASTGYGKVMKDVTDQGNPIKLKGVSGTVTLDKGLGVYANSSVVYDLRGKKYDRFTATVGIDQNTSWTGSSVEFQVWVDDVQVYASGNMTPATIAKQVDVDVRNKKKIELRVTDGAECPCSNAEDHAAWGDAKFTIPSTDYGTPSMTDTYADSMDWSTGTSGWFSVQRNRSVEMNPLTLRADESTGKTVYTRGLGTHANSSVVYNLAGKNFKKFSAVVGTDQEVGTNGSVQFLVLVDGVQKYASGAITGSTVAQAVYVDVEGASTIELKVTDNGNGNSSDHADWADAKFSSLETAYSVTIDNGITGGTVAVDAVNPVPGQQVNVTVTPASGKRLKAGSLKYTAGSMETVINGTSFTMPASDVVVTAQFEEAAESTPTTTITGPNAVLAGQDFVVKVGLSSVMQAVYAQDITLAFDPSAMTFVSAKEARGGISVVAQKVQNESGKLRLILVSQGAGNAITGSADVLELSFKANAVTQPAAGSIAIISASLGGASGQEVNATASSMSVSVTTLPPGIPGDINGDKKVSIGDLAVIAANYGKNASSPDWLSIKLADVDGDNEIDLDDLVLVASRILE
ncbi:NPCBM/NEW2 domain-containing protein [Paenibacillus aceris]|uniref:Dockerin domain-containing protein n=1 Tax=Paenibacillus aceris TaxID=869555 RepID=A0ABS4HXC2_9BACL|nr:NPCBM/NEW2 domain-containing protein [Paenibacillus aceris]MBP1963140.1 hypothetical protein [Paenibacillus aceris]NHW38741.1 sulfatase-like hydrolase/transferase [Paenibacillus aceris]